MPAPLKWSVTIASTPAAIIRGQTGRHGVTIRHCYGASATASLLTIDQLASGAVRRRRSSSAQRINNSTEAAACTASQALAPFFWLLRAAPSVGRSRDLIQRFITRPFPESPCDSPDDVIRNFRLNRTRPPSHPVAPFSRFPACVPCSTEIESKRIFCVVKLQLFSLTRNMDVALSLLPTAAPRYPLSTISLSAQNYHVTSMVSLV